MLWVAHGAHVQPLRISVMLSRSMANAESRRRRRAAVLARAVQHQRQAAGAVHGRALPAAALRCADPHPHASSRGVDLKRKRTHQHALALSPATLRPRGCGGGQHRAAKPQHYACTAVLCPVMSMAARRAHDVPTMCGGRGRPRGWGRGHSQRAGRCAAAGRAAGHGVPAAACQRRRARHAHCPFVRLRMWALSGSKG